jgi:Domain of unknown function (DUF6265)
MRRLALIIIVLGGCHAAEAPKNPTRIDDVAWLEGDWGGQDDKTWTEEHWISPRGGTMFATHRNVRDDKTVFFEFLRVEASTADIVYWAAPGGGPPTPFRLVKVEGQRASFYNPDHDYPQWIIYTRTGSTMTARIEGTENGTPKSHEWTWHRL